MKIYTNLSKSLFEYQIAQNRLLHSLFHWGRGHGETKEEAEGGSSFFPTKLQENTWKTSTNFLLKIERTSKYFYTLCHFLSASYHTIAALNVHIFSHIRF